MTREEFEAQYAADSNIGLEEYVELFDTYSCVYESGWQATEKDKQPILPLANVSS
jgi:hypothetical protein